MKFKVGDVIETTKEVDASFRHQLKSIPRASRGVIVGVDPTVVAFVNYGTESLFPAIMQVGLSEAEDLFSKSSSLKFDKDITTEFSTKINDQPVALIGITKFDIYYKNKHLGYYLQNGDRSTIGCLYAQNIEDDIELSNILFSALQRAQDTILENGLFYKPIQNGSDVKDWAVNLVCMYIALQNNLGVATLEEFAIEVFKHSRDSNQTGNESIHTPLYS